MTTPAVQAAAEQVHAAWTNAGPAPYHHMQAQLRLLGEWPTLARAIINLQVQIDEASRREVRP